MENFLETDTTPDMFPEYPLPQTNFTVGMKIEAVDPLNLATICVATVMKVFTTEPYGIGGVGGGGGLFLILCVCES